MNLVLFLVLIAAFHILDLRYAFWLAFLAGIVNDLIFANLLGLSSIIFLSLSFLVFLYRRKFSSSHLLFQLAFITLVNFFLSLFFNQAFSWKDLGFFLSLALIIYLLVNRIKGKEATLIK